MSDLLRADRPLVYAHRSIAVGETFVTENESHTRILVARGKATVVERDYAPTDEVTAARYDVTCSEPQVYTREEVAEVPPPPKRGRGRPKGSKNQYKRRDMVAEKP